MSAKKRTPPRPLSRKATSKPTKAKAKAKAKPKAKATPKPKTARAAKKTAIAPAFLDMLVQEAKAVRERAYAPYSKYAVGAAIATKRGSVFVGCNVENASLGATICAERGAIMQMVAAGEREPVAVAVVTGDDEPASPCGICRQVLAEFASDMPVVLVGLGSRTGSEGERGRVVALADLLPLQFKLHR